MSGVGEVRQIEGAGPARVRVEAAIIAAVATAQGARSGAISAAVAAHLGVPMSPALVLRVRSTLGLLIVRGAVDERGGRLFPGRRALRAS